MTLTLEPSASVRDDAANNDSNDPVDIDTALVLTGHRWFHWRLLLIGGFAFLATSFEFSLHAYILPFAECDLDIDSNDMGIINGLFMGGAAVASLFWGVLADATGRRRTLVISTTLEGLSTIIASWSNSFIMFATVRTISGFLCCGCNTIVQSYIGELSPDSARPRNLYLMGVAWTLSWILLPAAAVLILPLPLALDTGYITYKSWRLLVALAGILNLLGGLFIFFFLPELPKYYFAKGEESRALDVLRKVYSTNSGEPPEKYPVTRLCTGGPNQDAKPSNVTNVKVTYAVLCFNMLSQMKKVFVPPLLWSTILNCAVYLCAMFGQIGLGLWLPTIFDRYEDFYKLHPDVSVSVCELYTGADNFANTTLPRYCHEDKEINFGIFTNTFIMGAACVMGSLASSYLASKMPVRLLIALLLEIAGGCVVAIYLITSPVATVAMSALFLSASTAALKGFYTCAMNAFPTSVRGVGMCVSLLLGRISGILGSLAFGMLIDANCSIPILMSAGLAIAGGVICLLIPKSSQKALE